MRRLDSVNRHRQHDEFCVRLGAGRAKGDDQIVEHEGRSLLRAARHVSEELNGGTMERLETLESPAVGMRPPLPTGAPPLTYGWYREILE